LENEKPATIKRRLAVAAQALAIPLTIKRSGADVYFWTESATEEQPRRRQGRRRQKETLAPEQPLIELEFPEAGNSSEPVARIEPDLPSSPL
jgi:hypothetical protein